MKGSQTVSRTNYLQALIVSHFFSASKFYLLPLCFATPVLIGSTAIGSFAAPAEIAQVVVGGSVNRPTLKLGSQGERVSELQGALKLLGYYTGTVDGNFNQTTANAVSEFKQAAGLAPDSIVDGNTWQRLFPGEGTVASSPASLNPASKFPTPDPQQSSPRATTSTSQTTVRSSPTSGTSTNRSEQTLRTTSTNGVGQTSSSEQIVRTTSITGSGETVRTSRQTPQNQTSSSGETVRTSRQTPRNQTSSSGETTRTSRQTPRNQTSSSGETTRTSRQTPRNQTSSSGETTRTRQISSSGQTTRTRQTSSSGQTTRQMPTIQYTAGGMPILRIGMRGPEVVKLQERLKRLGFLDGDADGDFGASTEAAVKAAQQRYGLEPDGVAGGATWDVIMRRRSQPR
ncbi:peptidoglycan-binding protein [Plectonema radiosum NIES-515]|uniref:Peptidoglycan-binding protein n=1 Tax=Plectonema radiosum NIES-515 TaxID=2986073 RepID=A0ABT3ATL5_9CYAN|nr:peptidoglycan-binding protein [Plectonema radiosum]MCV3212453.1 peptidoglycan-binding protein [Plectonema radiosum NIES-515]